MRTAEPCPAAPWHEGEIAIQNSLGVAERMEGLGHRVIRDHLIEQHQSFYPQLPFVVLGAVDASGAVWATLRAGKPGFLHAPDPFHLRVEAARDPTDPADAGINDGAAVALLGIELATRRRNRLNGTVRDSGPDGFAIEVEESYGNCPRYIQPRRSTFVPDSGVIAAAPAVSSHLDDRAQEIIAGADTFFVATYVERDGGHRQVDVSHRGGRPGFVRIGSDGVLTIPDFSGNRFFNTLGNMVVNPRAGLVFVDFATGNLLQMTGQAEVILEAPEVAAFEGAERLWRFRPETIVFRAKTLPLRFSLVKG
ncbi:pyridoxamine 5'-phosphate oxidase-related FMN-binding (plasmid) [Methylobacterium nodulans ORS 2060]|uniref:Pyridoxamine 5'-phosphate oxidase-related FMN-binding n=2 Tax=Methylobacterium nodulans TaxID=114616 RepID=B8IW18_METNO|nr:pyridoxamine 5'-phosphate oxidase-related FMN-binding [Methylobacterium nodulans ORS 2060]